MCIIVVILQCTVLNEIGLDPKLLLEHSNRDLVIITKNSRIARLRLRLANQKESYLFLKEINFLVPDNTIQQITKNINPLQ